MTNSAEAEAARLAARPLRYEIYIRREGRWLLEEIVKDGREALHRPFDRRDLEALELRVATIANQRLAAPGAEALRVVQQRYRDSEWFSEKIILEKDADRQPFASVPGMGRLTEAPILCEGVDDLIGRPACRAIGILLGRLFVEINASPLEVLCDDSWGRRTEKYEPMFTAAIRATAAMQATGTAVKTRADSLERLVEAARRRRRAAFREPELAPSKQHEFGYAPGELDRYLAVVPATSPGDRRFLALRAICRALPSSAAWDGKVTVALSLPGDTGSAEAWGLIDEVVAGYLTNAKYVMELLGDRAELAGALEALLSLIAGAMPDGRCCPVAVPLAEALKAGLLPFSAMELWDRLLQSWASARPLTKGAFAIELDAQKKLVAKLSEKASADLKKKILEAGERRRRDLWQREEAQ